MAARYENTRVTVDPLTRRIRAEFNLVNGSIEYWRDTEVVFRSRRGPALSAAALPGTIGPGEAATVVIEADAPRERGRYLFDIYPAPDPRRRLFLEAEFHENGASIRSWVATAAEESRQNFFRDLKRSPAAVWSFAKGLWRARPLAWSLARRDLAARYRGAAGDALWALLQPLLLMLLYLFVFGVVLRARFPGDPSTQGFVLYFLAGMLPWLAISDPISRAPNLLPEHRNYVKKVVFPLEILNVSHVLAALAAQAVGLLILLSILLLGKGSVPATLAWLPLLLIPQVMMTLGVAWIFSAAGVFLRDLGQITGFLLTLVFFLTPICYPETSLPGDWLWLFRKNPLDMLVRGWRAILLEHSPPPLSAVLGAWLAGAALFALGAVVYSRLRRSFADVL
jgi:lipopolysaccharide transport system permease protein